MAQIEDSDLNEFYVERRNVMHVWCIIMTLVIGAVALAYTYALVALVAPLFGLIVMMNLKARLAKGVSHLTPRERASLNEWLSERGIAIHGMTLPG